MATAAEYQKYRAQSVGSLTPGEQVVLLFEHAAVCISKAMKCIESKDICGAHNAIVKAQNIYEYLMDSLDMNFEISKNLYSLYDFILDRLVQANIKKDTEILQQVLTMTRGFYDTWKQAELKSRHS